MGEILGVGLSHYPGFIYADDQMSMRVKSVLRSQKVPAHLRDPANWPPQMQKEWGEDEGANFAGQHRAEFVGAVLRVRDAIDDFRPDAVVIFGDDQYENFKEDIIPSLGVYIRDEFITRPFLHGRGDTPQPSIWGDAVDSTLRIPGNARLARDLTRFLVESNFDMAYSYEGHHESGLGHAFTNTVMYLNYDRRGWDYPIVPVHINSYGSQVIRNRGGHANLFNDGEQELDPPAPSIRRLFHFGETIAQYVLQSDARVVVIGSSSWSHAFLTAKNNYLYPDREADLQRYDELRSGNYLAWRELSVEDVDRSGQTELLNWVPLAGAMHHANAGTPIICEFHDTLLMNSCKCTALFAPVGSPPSARVSAGAGATQ
jgi:hypothetical protein